VDLPSFYEDVSNRDYGGKSTTTDVRKLIDKLKKEHVDGIVLDLRRNPGGSLTEAINCTGLFIKDGPVVQVKSSNGRLSVDEDPDPKMQYGGPLIVLTSKLSASASEILAGALQDYGRAVIVGDNSTHGKGTVQSLIQLAPIMQDRGVDVKSDPGALKLTIQKFYRPSGSSTQLKGVASDIQLPSITSVADIGEKSLPNPLPWDTVGAAIGMTKLNYVTPYIGELRTRSEARTANDKDFQLVRQEVARYQKLVATKVVSLNEEQRLKEKAEAEALAEERKKLLREHAAQPQKVSTLTLSDVDKPGLPEFKVEKAPKPKATVQSDPDAADESGDVVNDVALREAERILTDLIHLSTKTTTTAAVTPKKK
jgi:carboxyl-terminal processing protease